MSYVKNYNVGQIRIDLPTSNYIHELPLLSFGDIHGIINLSLVFNYGMKTENRNPYHITAGYKLNLQKRLIISDNVPVKFENENGKIVDLNNTTDANNNTTTTTDDIYTFDDDTGRILRKVGTTYELENPDFSRERYTSSGRIIDVLDKYGVTIYSYSYNSYSKLTSIGYRGKPISFAYDNQDRLIKVMYKTKTINLSYTTSEVKVSHYNGVTFKLTFSNENYTATATATENSTAVTYATKIERPSEYWKILKISNLIGTDIVDEMTYEFSDMIIDYPDTVLQYTHKHSQVDMTDKNGVKTRVQYQNEKLLYSYEVTTDGEYEDGNINIFNTIDDWENTNVSGKFNKSTGIAMYVTNSNTQMWEHNACDYYDSNVMGCYIITGWIRSKDNYVSSPLCISKGGGSYDIQFTPNVVPYKQWKYFAYKFYLNANFIKVFPENTGFVELKDLRIIFKPTHIIDNENGKRRIAITENVLVYHSGSAYDYLPIDEATFTCGSENLSDYGKVYFEDILRYKLNKKKGKHPNEVYYNKCKNVLYTSSSDELKVRYNGIDCSLSSFYLGSRKYTTNGLVTTVLKDDTNIFLVCEVKDANGTVVSSQVIDNKLDVTSATIDGITTSYARQNDLITFEKLGNLYTRTTTYSEDAEGNPTIKTKDEFNNTTLYTLDPSWGVVKSVLMPDGTVITNEYDNDMCTLVSKTFTDSNGNSKTHSFDYSCGNLTELTDGTINYSYTYSKGILSEVFKFDTTPIEKHVLSNDDKTLTSYYPKESGAIYSIVQNTDKYGRITSINGLVENTYKIVVDNGTYNTRDVDNGSSKLSVSKDLINGNETKYAYENGRINMVGVFNSSGTQISEKELTYDDAGRVTTDTFKYNNMSDSVSSDITYATETHSPTADSRVSNYSYKVNGTEKAKTQNSYNDSYKRLTAKLNIMGNYTYDRGFTYNKTRISRVLDVKNGSAYHDVSYGYDSLGRITSEADSLDSTYNNTYVYDYLGQLVRENNKSLDKTFIYSYNEIGNITKIESYPYTTGDVSGTPTTVNYTYSGDKLTNFNGKAILYNSIGYPIDYDGKNWSWYKGKLDRIYKGSESQPGSKFESCLFTYDGYGRRIRKYYIYDPNPAVAGDGHYYYATDYTYDESGRLIKEYITEYRDTGVTTTREFTFLYDESGIIGVMYRQNGGSQYCYYYRKNLQGDVVEIYNSSGARVCEYAYDAWGNCTLVYGAVSGIAGINPIRYRGYYYDRETKLYYLNARYYNPEWRRFISPDSTEFIDPESPNGLNLYAYCNNDPVNYCDPSGHSITLALNFAGTFAVGFGSSLFINAATNNWELDWRDFAQAGIDGLFAVAGTALAMTGICTGVSIGLGAVLGWLQYATGTKIQGGNLTLSGSITAIAFGAIGGRISGAGATNVKNVANHLTGLSDDGFRAAKAIATAMNRRMAGQISKRGFQGVLNLYGKTAFSAIDEAITITSEKLFKEAARNLAIYTPLANMGSGSLNYLYNLWGCI